MIEGFNANIKHQNVSLLQLPRIEPGGGGERCYTQLIIRKLMISSLRHFHVSTVIPLRTLNKSGCSPVFLILGAVIGLAVANKPLKEGDVPWVDGFSVVDLASLDVVPASVHLSQGDAEGIRHEDECERKAASTISHVSMSVHQGITRQTV